jgi:hypothetical protein
MRFVGPPNGSLEVSRFPVISVAFEDPVSADPAELAQGIRVLDRTGAPVPLAVRRSTTDDRVVMASPASAEDRLLPASDYFLEVGLGATTPEEAVRTYFRTGGAKSVFCVTEDAGAWVSTCDENYWRADPAVGLEPCTLPSPQVDGSCSCLIEEEIVLGGRRARCVCAEEEELLAGVAQVAVVRGVEPAAGANRATGVTDPIRIYLDRDLGANASLYRVVIDDITDGGVPPREVFWGPATSYIANTFELVDPPLVPNRRYRVTLKLAGAEPVTGPVLAGPEVHGFAWSFNTWMGPSGKLERTVPTPKTPGVSFPTHLPPWPHLRYIYDGPLPVGVEDTAGPVLRVQKYDGMPVYGYATWYDVDMNRLHLMVYQTLAEGERYEVYCTSAFAQALGDTSCANSPLSQFLVQVTPPEGGTDDIRWGSWVDLVPPGEQWLQIRPHVLNHPYGFKERYATDTEGPASFRGHVMLVPPSPAVTGVIRVDAADPNCLTFAGQTQPRVGVEGQITSLYIASNSACVTDSDCPDSYTCGPCPSSGNAGCPTSEMRCRWNEDSFGDLLLDYCRALVDDAAAACNANEAYRCVSGGPSAYTIESQARMNAPDESECPSGYRLHPTNNCVPSGRKAIEFADGDHVFDLFANGVGAWHHDPNGDTLEFGAPPVVFRAAQGARPRLIATVPLGFDGIPIPADGCRTVGRDIDGYRCDRSFGVCDLTRFQCVATQQNMGRAQKILGGSVDSCSSDAECFDGFRCDSTLSACVIDGNHAAFSCTGGDPVHPEMGGTCSASWVQIDADKNIWRIWWPHRLSSNTANRANIVGRITPVSGGDFEELEFLNHLLTDYSACDVSPDPRSCVLSACSDWNALSYQGQINKKLVELASDPRDPPIAFWAAGYRIGLGGGGPSCSFTALGSPSFGMLDGPIGLYLRLPAGDTPADFRIELSEGSLLSSVRNVGSWHFLGLSFQFMPHYLLIQDAEFFTIRGNQILDPSRTGFPTGTQFAAFDLSSVGANVSDNYLHRIGTLQQLSDSPQYVTINNVYWEAQAKIHTSNFQGVIETPVVCESDDADCVRPPCSLDHDCRIPFLGDGGEIVEDDPNLPGLLPTCEAITPSTSIGTCSHGIVRQGIYVDNVILDGMGPSGHWHRFRMQRNHLENGASQEGFDGSEGSNHLWLLDNLHYNFGPIPSVMKLAPTSTNVSRAVAVEGTLVVKNSPALRSQLIRAGKLKIMGESGQILSYQANGSSPPADMRGFRVHGNLWIERPGAFEWGAGAIGGLHIRSIQDARVSRNTVISDVPAPMGVSGQSGHPPLVGQFMENVVVGSDRDDYDENLCGDVPLFHDIEVASPTTTTLCGNLSERPDLAALDPTCAHMFLASEEIRDHLLHEPLPRTPQIDFETFQRSIVPDSRDEWERYRAFPVYDPAIEDDVYRIRPSRPECAFAGLPDSDCADPDSDGDLYLDSGDNCPNDFNPTQVDTDGDGIGDVCQRVETQPELEIPGDIPAGFDGTVSVPVNFTSNGHDIATAIFSVDYDESCLAFDPVDGDEDGCVDNVGFSVPGSFNACCTFNGADTDGELDCSIIDPVVPLAALPDGTLATILLEVTCEPPDCATIIIAPVAFSTDPAASLGNTDGESMPPVTMDGSAEISSVEPGDCNCDGVVDAGDLSACVLEIFDGDGSGPEDTPGGAFPGNPGCDANDDGVVDAGDLTCTVLLIFNGPGACGGGAASSVARSVAQSEGPRLGIPEEVLALPFSPVVVPIDFTANGHAIASTVFSVDYDESCLAVDPVDGDEDGCVDNVGFSVPGSFNACCTFNGADTDGELDCIIIDPVVPLAALPDGALATLTLTTTCDPAPGSCIVARVGFSDDPPASFGSTDGQSIPGTTSDGSVAIAADGTTCPSTTTTTSASTTTTTSTSSTTASSTTTTTLPPFGCPSAPDENCDDSFDKGQLLVNEKVAGKEKMMAKWIKGPQLAGTDYGNPLSGGGTAYNVCVYNEAGSLAGEYSVDRAGGTCGTKVCWKVLGKPPGNPKHKGYKYQDKDVSSDGIQLILMKAGDTGKSKALAKGKNNSTKGQLSLPTGVVEALSGSASVTVQLIGSDAPKCISVTLATVLKDDGVQFKAKK